MLVSEIIEKTRCRVANCFCNNTSFYNCPCISFSEILISSCGFELLSCPFISPGRSQYLTVKVKVHFSTCEYSFLLSSFTEKLSFPHCITLYCTPDHIYGGLFVDSLLVHWFMYICSFTGRTLSWLPEQS